MHVEILTCLQMPTKVKARQFSELKSVLWHGISQDIIEMVNNCHTSQEHHLSNSEIAQHQQIETAKPMQ